MLEVKNVGKSFGGNVAVNDVSFVVEPGKILGLIGQNGAGKTTTFRMILDFITPDQGIITWNGRPINQFNHDFIGYLPEERGLYPKMTVEQQILFLGQLHGMHKKDILQQLGGWMDRFQVKGNRKDKVKNLSKGNQQKVQLIASLIFMPKLAILDEPFSGLDPVNTSLLKDGIHYLQEHGSAIIFSSHDMSNVEDLSDQLVMLKNGKVVLNGTVSEVRNNYDDTRIYIKKRGITQNELEKLNGVNSVKVNGEQFILQLEHADVGPTIFEAVTKDGYIKEFSQQPPTLDEIFRMKVGDQNA
jgi:ABC-2 type transport system ATP-binding protein